jgi:hypothetical protein
VAEHIVASIVASSRRGAHRAERAFPFVEQPMLESGGIASAISARARQLRCLSVTPVSP